MPEYRPENLPEDRKKFQRESGRRILGIALLYAAVLAAVDAGMVRGFRGNWRVLALLCLLAALALLLAVLLIALRRSDRRLAAFREESNAIIRQYQDDHDGAKLWRALTSMHSTPQSFQQETMWYFNLAVALCAQRRTEDALDLLLLLSPCAEGEEKKLVDAYIRQIRENQSGHGSAAPSPSGDR